MYEATKNDIPAILKSLNASKIAAEDSVIP